MTAFTDNGLGAASPDVCPACHHVQANVNSTGPLQKPCRSCGGWTAGNVGAFTGHGLPRTLVHPGPGEECPQCRRRVPHPRKDTTPRDTHPLSFGRAPTDIVKELKDRLKTLASETGLSPLPYHQARVVMMLLEIAEAIDKATLTRLADGMSWGTRKGDE